MAEPRTRSSSSPSSASSQTSQSTTRTGAATRPTARPGFISHTEFASRDPAATRAFCERLFGWQFETLDGPTGPYHMFRFGGEGGNEPSSGYGGTGLGSSGPVGSRPGASPSGSAGSNASARIDASTGNAPSTTPASGGGIRALGKAEPRLAIPYVEVADIRQAEADATRAGAKVISPRVSMGSGSIVVLQIPGGPHIGLWAPN
ncbi:MAG TPA: hypothetical protein VM286_02950 [Candidatus Thermoplasmatota archaeon]|nr:hypothetical protein [Candidatus Thermoplasmatota archaeon]